MFGSKLRSWMEAVRPKRKHHKKDKQTKCNTSILNSSNSSKWQTSVHQNKFLESDVHNGKMDKRTLNEQKKNPSGTTNVATNSASNHSRYSANNLSSPESAYSTGYSTDGTSPGAGAPPDYLQINSSRVKEAHYYPEYVKPSVPVPKLPNVARGSNTSVSSAASTVIPKLTPNISKDRRTASVSMTQECEEMRLITAQARTAILRGGSPALGLTSPRQRNRIRTNPWLPGSTPSPALARHDVPKTPVKSTSSRAPIVESPRPRRFLSPITRRRSLSSSSCSSLSGGSLHWEPTKQRSAKSVSDEDDCTLNEMMGKYDESYIYEKETDILSDSDPTDCETDIDTGRDGGDEDDPLEVELDFIDNGSYLEFEPRPEHNSGHCSYYNYDVQRKASSRRRATRRNKQPSDKRRRSSSNKKRHKQLEYEKRNNAHLYGSKSAGATPVSVRRANQRPASKLALDDCLKKRSNSISFCREPITTIDKRDKEADLKYKELIVEAEHILRSMKSNGLSPRRLPGPANKRVELLRNTECTKPDLFVKNRPMNNDDNVSNNTIYSKIPSINYNCPRFSPKKNHITNFIISNSPILVRREWEMQAQSAKSPLTLRRRPEVDEVNNIVPQSVQKGILHQSKTGEGNRRSPKYRKKSLKHQQRNNASSSSDSDDNNKRNWDSTSSIGCPQSEPVRRKVYMGQGQGKSVAFNLGNEIVNGKVNNWDSNIHRPSSTENLRQQVLLNTIANLKRNLEDQSASLKQVYRSSQNIHT